MVLWGHTYKWGQMYHQIIDIEASIICKLFLCVSTVLPDSEINSHVSLVNSVVSEHTLYKEEGCDVEQLKSHD